MTSAERIFTALERKIPDRIPVMEMIIHPKIIRALKFKDYFELVDTLELDAVMVGGQQLAMRADDIETSGKQRKVYVNEWGVTMCCTGEVVDVPIDYPIKKPEDFKQYIPPDPGKNKLLEWLPEVVKRYKGKKAIIVSAREVFANSWNIRGMENYLMDYIFNHELIKDIARMVTDYAKELHSLLIRAGVDVILMGDDYAFKTGPLMSPAQFKEFIAPYLKEIVDNIKREGAYCIKHTDGNIWDIIDQIVETGVDCLGPLEPMAGMDLYEVKKRFKGQVCVLGNVDVDLLSRGEKEDIKKETLRLIELVGPGGGYILSSGNSISSSVRPENFIEMVKTVKKYGIY